MITVVITSCGRLALLKRTVESLLKVNSFPIAEWIIVDDSGNKEVHDQLRAELPGCELILKPHRGQIACIDDAYSRVKTPYIFHTEDDFEYLSGGFMGQSLMILESVPTVIQVWLLHGNNHPIEPTVYKAGNTEYRLLGHDTTDKWHGFTWNPGLRRLSDYKLVAPFSSFKLKDDFNALTECRIGQRFYNLGFRAAILNETYCKHIGVNYHVS